ncbi:hypothetical protein GCM10011338_25030 [Alteromonas lipolytica]|nr:hypothetical protein GCM10011338_25030 [Alteromonas lipolytica]
MATALVSPYTRTRQSFQQVTNTLHASQFEICNDITPDGNVRLAHDYMDLIARESLKNSDGQPVLLVSHMPFVSFFLDEICEAPKMALFATGSVAVVRYWVNRGKGVLLQHFQGF